MLFQTQGIKKNGWLDARLSPLSSGKEINVVTLVSWVGTDLKNKARQGNHDLISREMTLPIHWAWMKSLPEPCQHIRSKHKRCKNRLFLCAPPESQAQRGRMVRLSFLNDAWFCPMQWFQTQPASEDVCSTDLQREFSPGLENIKISSPTKKWN